MDGLEAYFGGFRVTVNGTDVRGFWDADSAHAFAARVREVLPGDDVRVRDGRDQDAVRFEQARLAEYPPEHPVAGDLGSVPLC
jgi:hypothetical protein